jgi:hypothetical protein
MPRAPVFWRGLLAVLGIYFAVRSLMLVDACVLPRKRTTNGSKQFYGFKVAETKWQLK